jgi:hypothetical protein
MVVPLIAGLPSSVEGRSEQTIQGEHEAACPSDGVGSDVRGDPELWFEATALTSGAAPTVLVFAKADSFEPPEGPVGQHVICTGGSRFGTRCVTVDEVADFAVPEATRGIDLLGKTQTADGVPSEATIRLVPSNLRTVRPFTMPLLLANGKLLREVESSASGIFCIPNVGSGDYTLEIAFAEGQLVHSDPFSVPTYESWLREEGGKDRPVVLGEFSMAQGGVMEVTVVDDRGIPVDGANVGWQEGGIGDPPRKLFKAVSDGEGVARLRGLDLSAGGELRCWKAITLT